jgi:hypothetical protein
MWKLVLVYVALVVMVACGAQSDLCNDGQRLVVHRNDLKAALIGELASMDVAYKEASEGTICFERADADLVLRTLKDLDHDQRPRNRVTIPHGVSDLVFDRLNAADIPFQMIAADGEIIMIFSDEATAARAFAIVGEVFSELSRARGSN